MRRVIESQGEEVIIAKNNLPLVERVPHKPGEKRKLGLLAGQIRIPDDFLDEDPQINEWSGALQ